MNDSQLSDLLRDKNGWWRDPIAWRADDSYLREVANAAYIYEPDVLAGIEPPGLFTLTGPRRVGKSVEIRRAIARLIDSGIPPRSIIYCSCDGFRIQDLRRLFVVGRNLTQNVTGPRWWFIDEVTAAGPEWSAIVKDARDDSDLRNDCVVLTGSSARGLREATKNLAGRRRIGGSSDRFLFPMSFRAFCSATSINTLPDIPVLRPKDLMTQVAREAFGELSYWANDLATAWENYLQVGGYPRAVNDFLRHGDVQIDFTDELWDVIRGDAIRETSLSDTDALLLLDRIAINIASPFNATRVADELDMGSHHQVNNRINDLMVAFFAWKCHQNNSGRPNAKASKKIYFIDPLVSRLPSIRNHAFPRPDASRLSEQQLGFALARALQDHRPQSFITADGVLYERTATRKEIDFVGPELEIPFESKYVERSWKQESLPIKSGYGHGIIATRTITNTENSVWAIPVSQLVWLLG